MKVKQILVGVNGAALNLNSGSKMIAVMPPARGDKEFFGLLDNGKLASLKGARIAGVSVSRYCTENGFIAAPAGNQAAEVLADLLDQREAIKLVERTGHDKAHKIRATMGGQKATFVPFDLNKEIIQVQITPPNGFITTSFEFGTGFSDPQVETVFGSHGSGVALGRGWIVSEEQDAATFPRNTEYGGIVERAVYVICNCGIGELVGPANLEPNDDVAEYARGRMDIKLPSGDTVIVAVDGADELSAVYVRDGEVIYRREGLTGLSIGAAIGSIAGVLVRVNELDAAAAQPVKKTRKKAA